jgi:transcriptional regulator with PAS, ATPase and Fis domain
VRRLENENIRLRAEAQERYRELVGDSTKMLEIKQLIAEVARSRSTVMIGGESGTGKELIAHAIHDRSKRENMPFLTVNCAGFQRVYWRMSSAVTRRGLSPGPTGKTREI